MEILSNSSKKTKKAGEELAFKVLNSNKRKNAFFIGLRGDLGGGKTTFIQGFAKGLGIKEKILSPTFTIFKRFEIKNNDKFKNLYHFDVYRIKNENDLNVLSFDEIIKNAQNIIIVEWVDLIKKKIPKDLLIVDFEFINEKKRKIIIKD